MAGHWPEKQSKAPFFRHNQALIGSGRVEAKARRQDILVDPETLFAFYDEIIPADVVNGAGFDAWRKRANPEILFTRDYLMQRDATYHRQQYPDKPSMSSSCRYHFAPGEEDDGVTVSAGLPAAAASQTSAGVVGARYAGGEDNCPHSLSAQAGAQEFCPCS